MNRHKLATTLGAALLPVLLTTACGEGPVNDNEGTPPGVEEGPGSDVGSEEEEEEAEAE